MLHSKYINTLDKRQYAARFETNKAELWGIDEQMAERDRHADTQSAQLTLIISLKDRRSRLDTDRVKTTVREELHKLLECNGQWNHGSRPDILSYEDIELDGFDCTMLSRRQWVVSAWITGVDASDPEPAGHYEWMSSRGVR